MKSCEKKRKELICTANISKIEISRFKNSFEFLPVQSSFFPIPFPYFIAKVPSSIFDSIDSPLIPPTFHRFTGGGESRSSAGNRVRPPFLLPSHPTLWFPPILIPPRPYFSTDPASSSFVFLPFFPLRGDCSSLRDRIFT